MRLVEMRAPVSPNSSRWYETKPCRLLMTDPSMQKTLYLHVVIELMVLKRPDANRRAVGSVQELIQDRALICLAIGRVVVV